LILTGQLPWDLAELLKVQAAIGAFGSCFTQIQLEII
jgi:hypothetical protein